MTLERLQCHKKKTILGSIVGNFIMFYCMALVRTGVPHTYVQCTYTDINMYIVHKYN